MDKLPAPAPGEPFTSENSTPEEQPDVLLTHTPTPVRMPTVGSAPAPLPSEPFPASTWPEGWSSDAQRTAMREQRLQAEIQREVARMADRALAAPSKPVTPLDDDGHHPDVWAGEELAQVVDAVEWFSFGDDPDPAAMLPWEQEAWDAARQPDDPGNSGGNITDTQTAPIPPAKPTPRPRVQKVPVSRPNPKARAAAKTAEVA